MHGIPLTDQAYELKDKTLAPIGGEEKVSSDARKRYIAALQSADNQDFAPLIAFARS